MESVWTECFLSRTEKDKGVDLLSADDRPDPD